MRLFPVMFISAVLTASAMAQNQWEQNVRGVFDLYPTQRLAVEGIADEFVTEVRAAPGFDERHWQIVVAKLSEDQSGLPALPGGNKGVAGSGGVNGVSFQFGQSITDGAAKDAVSTALSRLRQKIPRAKISAGNLPNPPAENQAVLATHTKIT